MPNVQKELEKYLSGDVIEHVLLPFLFPDKSTALHIILNEYQPIVDKINKHFDFHNGYRIELNELAYRHISDKWFYGVYGSWYTYDEGSTNICHNNKIVEEITLLGFNITYLIEKMTLYNRNGINIDDKLIEMHQRLREIMFGKNQYPVEI